VRDRYRVDADWKRYTRGFQQHLKGQQNALDELSALASTARCALPCYEADFNLCHRSLVANALHEQYGADVRHIEL
jgi:uncharacterized protein (DUF488 family)